MKLKIDTVGRILIPKVIRKTLDIQLNSNVEVNVEENKIIITKQQKD